MILLAGQPVASAAVAGSMDMGDAAVQTTLAMDQGKTSCHNHHEKAPSSDSSTSIKKNNPVGDCCDIDCQCPSGNCSTAAMPYNNLKNDVTTVSIIKNNYDFQWFASQARSSLYRPPIHL